MKILITGGNGFLARELASYFTSNSHNVITTNRNSLDPTNYENVKAFFEHVEVDALVHTAVKGGRRGHQENMKDMLDNLAMFHNLRSFSHKYKVMFNFGSGAEFDRTKNISKAEEPNIFNSLPADYYGLSKNLISRDIIQKCDNAYNLRLFGCFGINEEPQRLFKATYDRFINGEDAVIHQDRWMDYFYAQDVGKVIEHIFENRADNIPKDINLCYREKYKLSDYVNKIKNLMNVDLGVIIQDNTYAYSYDGNAERLQSLNINLHGLEKGLQECLKSWNKS
jgi:GDP-L-fucose synthase